MLLDMDDPSAPDDITKQTWAAESFFLGCSPLSWTVLQSTYAQSSSVLFLSHSRKVPPSPQASSSLLLRHDLQEYASMSLNRQRIWNDFASPISAFGLGSRQ